MDATNDPYMKQVKRLWERTKQVRTWWEPVLQDCYDYVLPMREHFFQTSAGERRQFDRLFDSTALVATSELASRLQGYLTPVEAKWCDLKAGPLVDARLRDKVDLQLADVRDYLFAVLHAGNFDQQNHEAILDACIGSGTLMIVAGDYLEPVKIEAVPMPQLYLLSGPFNRTFAWFRMRELPVADVPATWPRATIPQELQRKIDAGSDDKVKVVEGVWRDLASTDERYEHCVFLDDKCEQLFRGEYRGWGSNPFITFHWSKAAGHSWGVGPVQLALPDIKTLNLVQELLLQNAEMSITGMWQAEDDGVINPDTIQLVPGTIIPKARGSDGLQPLASPGDIELSQFLLEKMQMNVKKALYDEPLGAIDGAVKSATEIDERMADLSRRIGSSSGRLKAEHAQAIITRVSRILADQGRIELPKVDGKIVKAQIVSPLARSQQQEEVIRFTRFAQTLGATFPQLLPLIVDGVRSGRFLAENIGVPPKLLVTAAERVKTMQGAAAVAEGLGQAPTGASDAVRSALGGV